MESSKENLLGTSILEQNFNQLSPEGKVHLKEYLQNLLSMQKVMDEANNALLLNDEQKVC